MDSDIVRKQETYLRVREFGIAFAARIPATSLATTLLARINQIITQMEAATLKQSSGSRAENEATTSKWLARDELIEDLMRISRTARSMRRAIPGLEDKFRSPGKLKDQELLAFARGVAADAVPFKAEFTKRGLPEDFLEDLNDDVERFEEAIAKQTQGGSEKVGARAAVEELAADGMETLRELDPIIRNIFEDDPEALAAWLRARHVERAPRKKKKDKEPKS